MTRTVSAHHKAILSAVFNCIRSSPKAGSEIEKALGLKHVTVQTIIAELISLDMIREAYRHRNAAVYAEGV